MRREKILFMRRAIILLSLLVIGISSAQELNEEFIYETENKIVEQIKKYGPQDKFLIREFRPEEAAVPPSRVTIRRDPSGEYVYKAELSKDKLIFKLSLDRKGMESNMWGLGCIHRFDGEVKVGEGYTFLGEGDKLNRLTFVVLDQGYVYVRGKGRVISASGKEVKLGYPSDLTVSDFDRFFKQGLTYAKSGNYREAIKAYDKAIELNPNIAAVYSDRGFVHFNLGNSQQAIKDFDKAIDLNPKDPAPYANLGYVYYQLDFRDKAIEKFKIAAKLGFKDSQEFLRSQGIQW